MKNLLFFNKEGYPHNFQYDNENEKWEGKIIFDENSDQTFKTQSIYIFESVDPIDMNLNSNLVNIEYFDTSGVTINGETNYKNEIITDIIKVNNAPNFYSKWIHGENFDKKFPVGTVISFSDIQGFSTYLSDFSDEKYFTVLTVKKGAFLIITETNNSIFVMDFYSGKTTSLNMISINDYNRNLENTTFIQNLYINKKFSIIDSYQNDAIVSIKQSGITQSYLNDIKISGNENDIFKLKINLLTERPKVFRGDVFVTYGYILNVGRFANDLKPTISHDSNGDIVYNKKEIIFQDNYGEPIFNGYTILVDSLIDTIDLGIKKLKFKTYYKNLDTYTYNSKLKNYTQWNTIQFSGETNNLKINDIIYVEGIGTNILNTNREFNITDIVYNTTSGITILFTDNYIIDSEDDYNITKKLKSNQITSVNISVDLSSFNNIIYYDIFCYQTSAELIYTQTFLGNTEISKEINTIESFITKNKASLYQYGIDVYHTTKDNSEYLSIESLYSSETLYLNASGYINGYKIVDDFTFSESGATNSYNIITNEKLYSENTNRTSNNLYNNDVSSQILFNLHNETDKFGFRITLNGTEYFINFIIDTQTTINEFIDKYFDIMENNGFIISLGYITGDDVGYTLDISSNIDIWDLEVMVNILSTYKITKKGRNQYMLLSGNELRSVSKNLFDIGLSTGMLLKITGSSYSTNNGEYNIISLTEDVIGLSYQSTLVTENNVLLYCKTRDFIRKPRGDYDKDIYFRAYWDIPYDNEIDDSIFFYDITGNQLQPYNDIENLKYIGETPLINSELENIVMLNDEPNKNITQIKNPRVQQTVFNELIFKLDQLDSSNHNWIPEPLEIFIGYNSDIEGVNTRSLKIEKIEKMENNDNYFSYTGFTNSGLSLSFHNFTFDGDTIYYNAPIDFNFTTYGFKKEQVIKCYFKDQSKYNQKIFDNPYKYKIKNISRNKLIIDTNYSYEVKNIDSGYTYSPGEFNYFNTTGTTFFFKLEIQPIEVLSCPLYGQTEIEDLRYKVNLNNLGIRSEDDVYKILYASDIEDNAIDYTLFNRKRKEMLTSFKEIYDYIGSYKSLVNAINYFGYNDLQLYEYYKQLKNGKLHKMLIPDIFDNSVEGWNDVDFITGKFQNQSNFTKTNLFNLTYRITDEEGNNILIYTLEEVQYKLTKLKKWLRENIIPISANLLDITGLSETKQTLYQDYDESNQTMKYVIERNSTVVNFNYTATLNFENNYLVTVNFYTISGNTGTTIDYNEIPESYSVKIKTFYLSGCTTGIDCDTLIPVQYFKLNKTDLKPFSFNLNKNVDPYIYIETTTYDNGGNGLGYVNNKIFYYDEPRNYWLVSNNFNLSKMKYYQSDEVINNNYNRWTPNLTEQSTIVDTSVETIVITEGDSYISKNK